MSYTSAPTLRRLSIAALGGVAGLLLMVGSAETVSQPARYDRSWETAPEGTSCRIGPGDPGHVVVARFKGKVWNQCHQLLPGTTRLYE